MSVFPNKGSIGGTTLVANVQGVGHRTKVDIVDSAGSSICLSTKVTEYGKVICETKAIAIAAGQVSVKVGTSSYQCANSDTSKCKYEQVQTGFPLVSSIAISNGRLILTGTDFFTSS